MIAEASERVGDCDVCEVSMYCLCCRCCKSRIRREDAFSGNPCILGIEHVCINYINVKVRIILVLFELSLLFLVVIWWRKLFG